MKCEIDTLSMFFVKALFLTNKNCKNPFKREIMFYIYQQAKNPDLNSKNIMAKTIYVWII